ncbi:YdcF family protein [Arthrobacter methylotrophus]|uniref:YdcF family protein n=1 Tax=Arthrobacter methylotrophus TaxID=121291 RepID=A0ABV5USQ5_9MICC
MLSLVLGLLFAVLFLASYRSDKRRLRNGVLLVAAVWFLLLACLGFLSGFLASFGLASTLLYVGALLCPPLCALVFAGFLIANGVTMIRKEGPGISSLLPFAVGLAVILTPVAAFLLLKDERHPALYGFAVLGFFLAAYVGCAFVAFLGYALLYSKARFDPNPAAIIILGSGLIGGKVPPLLAARLNKALEIYNAGTHAKPLLVPSGGQGFDEPRPESAAMKEYLLTQDAAGVHVLEENRATNTRENLEYSVALLKERGVHGPLLVCTNNYHAPRAALLCRRHGIDAAVVGAPTARYFVPSAFLREFVAVMRDNKRTNIILCLPMLGIAVLITWLLMTSSTV